MNRHICAGPGPRRKGTRRTLAAGLFATVVALLGSAYAASAALVELSVDGHAATAPPPTRVLFIGNSYQYYNDSLHNHVKRMVGELRPELAEALQYKSSTIGGARLQHHNIDWLLEPGRIGVRDPFEVVVLQGGSAEVLGEESRARFYDTATEYSQKARQIGARPYLYMTHAYVPPHQRAREDMIDDIAAAYREAARRADAGLIPVGLAFAESYRRRPDLALHKSFDGSHPSLQGTYLAACVVVRSLYGLDLAPLSYDYYGALSAADVDYLKAVATDITSGFNAGEPAP